MPDLKSYRQKRDPEATPEPFGSFGEGGEPRSLPANAPREFVVQQHAARNMHWDLRLEIGGTLASWAIPRGPSLDPQQKRLAVQTEDHPLEYADFEGVIPEGNYGAGAMIVWDRGLYHTADELSPAEGLAAGKLDLVFDGFKLRGRFALVHTKGEGGRQWLLIKKGQPPEGEGELVEAEPASVLSGLTVQDLEEERSRETDVRALLEKLDAPPAKEAPRKLRPMLAGTRKDPFSREGWVFELKYDGVRVLCAKHGEDVHVYARSGADRTGTYPEIARALALLPLDQFVLDGEIVATDASGRSSFERLQRRFTQTDPSAIAAVQREIPVRLYAFDLLQAAGRSLVGLPLVDRKRVLAEFVPRKGFISFADHVEGDGEALFRAAQAHELEGIVAKRADSKYEAGRRAKTWFKIKNPKTELFCVVGWTPGKGARAGIGSLALGWHRDGRLVYAGNAGSGLTQDVIDALLPDLQAAELDAPACELPAPGAAAGTRFVRPEKVCEVRFTETTSAGLLRQPVFLRMRDDAEPSACTAPDARREEPVATDAPAQAPPEPELKLTRLEKVFWPVEGYTKGDLLGWYEAVWPWLEPYLRDRPVVLTRYPDGIEGKSFYQKNAPDFTPDWALRQTIDGTEYFLCNDLRTLLYVINSGAIPLHVWSARRHDLDRPDWLILDLDPKEAPFAHVVDIARFIHRLLDELDAEHYVKTSGQDGLHVLLPLGGALDHGEAKLFGEVLARVVAAELPDIATTARPVAARGQKVYVDYLQNGRGKLIASIFSVRPRAGAPVSMPLRWSQVTRRLDPARWTIRTALPALEKSGDPMAPLLEGAVDVPRVLGLLGERLAAAVE